uniref:rRNA biogenesis protein RRP36 n=1 Tax=Neogobius melanostomus TaxID=47308 RepID=A0A8C6WJN2_9GOBI
MKKKQNHESSSDDDSDAERNFALFAEKQEAGAAGTRAASEQQEEEEEESVEEGEESDAEGEESEKEMEETEEEGEESEEEGEESDKEGEESDKEEAESGTEGEESDEAEADKGSNELRTSEDVQKELSHMSFEDLLKLQNKVGTKVYNKVRHGAETEPSAGRRKRLNKNRPMEVSAKRPAPFLRQVVSVKKTTLRDPRFDDLSGEYKPDIFEKTYSFINDIKHKEKELIKKKLMKTKSEKHKEKLQFLVKRMENQERARLSREQQRNRELEFKRAQRERANQGQAPRFIKNSEKKKLQLLEKYDGLKRSGKLDQFLTKRGRGTPGKTGGNCPHSRTRTHREAFTEHSKNMWGFSKADVVFKLFWSQFEMFSAKLIKGDLVKT